MSSDAHPDTTEVVTTDKLDATVLKIAAVVVLAAVMSILDTTVVTVAIPTFQAQFGTSYTVAAWTMTIYTLALATVIPLTGWAADRFGTKRPFALALALFTTGSVLCSTAGNIGELLCFRAVQGLGGGMIMPLGMTIVTKAAGPERMGRVMAVLGGPMLLGPICGPILGGWMIQVASWRWIFLINLPIGLAALISARFVLPRDEPRPAERFDLLGMLLLSPGLAVFLFGITQIPEMGTVASARVIVPVVIGALLILIFVWHALRYRHPLLDLRLFRHRSMATAVGTVLVFAAAFYGAGLLIPSYLMQIRGQSALDAGLLIAPEGIGAMITIPLAGMVIERTGPGRIVPVGIALIGLGLAVLTGVGPHTSYTLLLSALFVMGVGMGATMMPLMTGALRTLAPHETARGSTMMNIVQQTGASIGTATMSVILTTLIKYSAFAGSAVESQHDPNIARMLPPGALDTGFRHAATAYAHTFVVAALMIAVAFLIALLLPRSKTVAEP
jgi:EmrB/QacA subfamily drug resistance transporter